MRKADIFKYLWLAGLALMGGGEIVTAFDARRGNTISELFDRLPRPAQFAVFGGFCAVLSHWVWPMPVRELVIGHADEVIVEAPPQHRPASHHEVAYWGGKANDA